ncbi:TonB-linked outer membrane protein, SusC/RagA family [uncultured Paludibacter sp.]|nr:TonB-linked outer membrane protein, SusC/RagA family [uncultured Paludibacter sp.]
MRKFLFKKRAFVLFAFLMLGLTSFVFAQKVSLNSNQQNLKQVLESISRQTGYTLAYSKEVVNLNEPVNINVKDAELSEVMAKLLNPLNLSYEIKDKKIYISDKSSQSVSGQQIQIQGKVLDTKGEPIIGATVKVKGASSGTITNFNGEFSLETTVNSTLIVSYIGYKTAEINIGNKKIIDINLEEDVKGINEIVVTALGIKREQKALGYSVQTVDGEQLQKVSGTELGTALTGKVSGLLVKNSTDFGVTPTITIRGENPLIVIDGVPYTNKKISDISAADIESMNVLKGSTASALYGEKGATGAILITTKNGRSTKGGLSVDVSTNTMYTAGFLAIPGKQSMYGRGTNNKYDKNSTNSWGQLMDGSIQNQWDPYLMDYADYEYLPIGKNNFKNFLEQGYATNNNVSVAYKTDVSAVRSSLNWIENKGQYPNSKLDRYNYSLGGDINLNKFTISSNLSYSKKTIPNLGSNGYTSYDPMYSLLIWSACDFDLMDYKNNYWMIKDQKQNYTYQSGVNNPYFDRYEKTNESDRDIFNADVTTSYQITKWLKTTLRTGLDYYTDLGKQKVSIGSYVSLGNTPFPGNLYPWNGTSTGAYNTGKTQGFSINSDLIFTGDRKIDKLTIEYLFGGAINYNRDETLYGMTNGGLSIPGFYSLKASVNSAIVGESRYAKQVNSLYGRMAFSWDRLVYLDVTGRNDWSSTLAASQRSYFYPSVAGSFVISELLPDTKNWLDLLKIRTSWTQSKKMAGIYEINPAFTITSATWGTLNGATAPTSIYPADIKPATASTFETGFQGIFFKNRLSVDLAYYKTDYYDNIIFGNVSPSTGYTKALVNTNERTARKGVELTLGGTPIKNKDWQWDINANWSKYARYYTQLDSVYTTKKPWIKVGERVDVFYSKDFIKNPETGEYITNNGRLQYSKYDSKFGYSDPDFVWGLSTTLRYKNLSLYMSVDGVVGGLMNTRTESYMWQSGSHPNSLSAERAADVADPNVGHYLVDGVKVTGGTVTYDEYGNITSDTRTYAANDQYISYKQYIIDLHNSSAWGGNGSPTDTYSKTFVKLREISLTYLVPNKYLYKFAKSASVSLVGQNVFLWAKDFKYSDPDGGTEDFADPSVRYLGFNIKLTF